MALRAPGRGRRATASSSRVRTGAPSRPASRWTGRPSAPTRPSRRRSASLSSEARAALAEPRADDPPPRRDVAPRPRRRHHHARGRRARDRVHVPSSSRTRCRTATRPPRRPCAPGHGSCVGRSLLAAELLLRAGVPTRQVTGLLVAAEPKELTPESRLVYNAVLGGVRHRWIEVYVPVARLGPVGPGGPREYRHGAPPRARAPAGLRLPCRRPLAIGRAPAAGAGERRRARDARAAAGPARGRLLRPRAARGAASRRPGRAALTADAGAPGAPLPILVVLPSPPLRILAASPLSARRSRASGGFPARRQAGSALDALWLVARERPVLALVSLDLPVLSGDELVALLRARPGHPEPSGRRRRPGIRRRTRPGRAADVGAAALLRPRSTSMPSEPRSRPPGSPGARR